MSRGEYSEPWREWQQAAPSSGPVLWLSAVIVTGDMMGVTVTPDLNTHGAAQCPVASAWPGQFGGVRMVERRRPGTVASARVSVGAGHCRGQQWARGAADMFGWPLASSPALPSTSLQQLSVLIRAAAALSLEIDVQRCVQSDVMSVQRPLQSGRKFSLRNQEFRITPQ